MINQSTGNDYDDPYDRHQMQALRNQQAAQLAQEQQQDLQKYGNIAVSDINSGNYAGAWNAALETSPLYGTNYNAATTDPLLAAMESGSGLKALDPTKQWNSTSIGQYYQALYNNPVYKGQAALGLNGQQESLGKNPYGLWGSSKGFSTSASDPYGSDAAANATASGDSSAPDVERFAGARPDLSFLDKYGSALGSLALTALTAGAAAPLAGALFTGTTALDVAGAGALIGAGGTSVLDAATGKPLTLRSVAGGALQGAGANLVPGLGGALNDATSGALGSFASDALAGAGVGAAKGALSGGNIGISAAVGGVGGALQGSGVLGQAKGALTGAGVPGAVAGAAVNGGTNYALGAAANAVAGTSNSNSNAGASMAGAKSSGIVNNNNIPNPLVAASSGSSGSAAGYPGYLGLGLGAASLGSFASQGNNGTMAGAKSSGIVNNNNIPNPLVAASSGSSGSAAGYPGYLGLGLGAASLGSFASQGNNGTMATGTNSTDSSLAGTILGSAGGLLQAGAGTASSLAASNAQVNADQNAITTQQNNLGNINNIWATQQQTGQGANSALQSSLGLNGQTANPSNFLNMPGYQFAVQQGTQAIQRQAAALGNAYTPNTAAAVGQYVTGTASQDYNTYISQLMGAAGLGTTANQGLQTANQSTANNISQLQQNIGQAQAQGYSGVGSAVGGLFGQNGAGTGLINSLFGHGNNGNGGGGGGGVGSGGVNSGGVNSSGVPQGNGTTASNAADPFSGTSLANNQNAFDAYNQNNVGNTGIDPSTGQSWGSEAITTPTFDPNSLEIPTIPDIDTGSIGDDIDFSGVGW